MLWIDARRALVVGRPLVDRGKGFGFRPVGE